MHLTAPGRFYRVIRQQFGAVRQPVPEDGRFRRALDLQFRRTPAQLALRQNLEPAGVGDVQQFQVPVCALVAQCLVGDQR
ncbi:Uncharacterised protein [Mycobacteroides abscessus subsp. abscessus]|nr:Uncharacterised protein [Mycobacteroides abscessus subsp. abscessus]